MARDNRIALAALDTIVNVLGKGYALNFDWKSTQAKIQASKDMFKMQQDFTQKSTLLKMEYDFLQKSLGDRITRTQQLEDRMQKNYGVIPETDQTSGFSEIFKDQQDSNITSIKKTENILNNMRKTIGQYDDRITEINAASNVFQSAISAEKALVDDPLIREELGFDIKGKDEWDQAYRLSEGMGIDEEIDSQSDSYKTWKIVHKYQYEAGDYPLIAQRIQHRALYSLSDTQAFQESQVSIEKNKASTTKETYDTAIKSLTTAAGATEKSIRLYFENALNSLGLPILDYVASLEMQAMAQTDDALAHALANSQEYEAIFSQFGEDTGTQRTTARLMAQIAQFARSGTDQHGNKSIDAVVALLTEVDDYTQGYNESAAIISTNQTQIEMWHKTFDKVDQYKTIFEQMSALSSNFGTIPSNIKVGVNDEKSLARNNQRDMQSLLLNKAQDIVAGGSLRYTLGNKIYDLVNNKSYSLKPSKDPKSKDFTHKITMDAIMMAESGGNPNAVNTNRDINKGPVEDSLGLFQINWDVWGQGVEYEYLNKKIKGKLGKNLERDDLFYPDLNRELAEFIKEKQGYSAWSAYSNGAYVNFLASDPDQEQHIITQTIEDVDVKKMNEVIKSLLDDKRIPQSERDEIGELYNKSIVPDVTPIAPFADTEHAFVQVTDESLEKKRDTLLGDSAKSNNPLGGKIRQEGKIVSFREAVSGLNEQGDASFNEYVDELFNQAEGKLFVFERILTDESRQIDSESAGRIDEIEFERGLKVKLSNILLEEMGGAPLSLSSLFHTRDYVHNYEQLDTNRKKLVDDEVARAIKMRKENHINYWKNVTSSGSKRHIVDILSGSPKRKTPTDPKTLSRVDDILKTLQGAAQGTATIAGSSAVQRQQRPDDYWQSIFYMLNPSLPALNRVGGRGPAQKLTPLSADDLINASGGSGMTSGEASDAIRDHIFTAAFWKKLLGRDY